jgi:hypothetical protein
VTNNWIFISIIAGLAAALLHISIVTLTPLSALLFYLAPLPLFIVGLRDGWRAAAAAAVVGALALTLLWNIQAGAYFLAATAAGPVVISRLALISRPVTAGANEGEATDGTMQWYPEGRLLLWMAAMAGALLTIVILLVGPDAESFRAALKEISATFTQPLLNSLPAEQQERFAELMDLLILLTPVAGAAAWFVSMTINLLLASRLLQAWKAALRPWAPFASLTFPRAAGAALAVSFAASVLPGTLGLIGSVFAAPLSAAFAILGLAVAHSLLLAHPSRVALLAGLYLALVLMSWIVAVPLILLGIAELGWNLRARARPAPPINRNT